MRRRQFLATAAAVLASAPAFATKYYRYNIPDTRPSIDGKIYDGPVVTQILVEKSKSKMMLLHGKKAIKTYNVEFGFNPVGHKQKQGDGRTPEGVYYLDRRNYNSAFYLSLGISYPNAQDRADARARGVDPGGDIFIHGLPNNKKEAARAKENWTAGCISVRDFEMREIFWMVRLGTPILIKP